MLSANDLKEFMRLNPPDWSFSQKPTTIATTFSPTYRQSMEFGRQLRDNWLHQYAILPNAITVFNDIASSREWMVMGTKNAALKALDRINSSFMYDSYGIKHTGWEQMVSRMCNDWLLVGRCMFRSRPVSENWREWSPFEYIDPVNNRPVMQEDGTAIWQYTPRFNNRRGTYYIPQEELFFLDNIRIGQSGSVLGRAAYTIPMANLDWLIRQHDTLSLDGRMVKDIILVHKGMMESIESGIIQLGALANGEDPSKVGIPVMEVDVDLNNYKGSLKDLIAKVGLSDIPEGFQRSELEMRYVREISAALGLPIGQFWNDPRGTNRALEQVTQERSTLKGPSYFVRSICRMINNTDMMGTTKGNTAVLQVEEETDNSSLAMKAEAIERLVNAANGLNQLMLTSTENVLIQPDQWLGYFQRMGLIPPNMTLPNIVAYEEQSLNRNVDDIFEKGFVRVNLNGDVIENRHSFIISKGYNDTTITEGNNSKEQ